MSEEREHQHSAAYTAPAGREDFQFSSSLESAAEVAAPAKVKNKHNWGPLVAAVLILLAAGTAFCVLFLRLTISVRRDENGFSVALERRSAIEPIQTALPQPTPEPEQVLRGADGVTPDWSGAPLHIVGGNNSEELSYRQIYIDCAPSLAIVTCIDSAGRSMSGTAIVLTEDGALVASAHLIHCAEAVTISLNGTEYAVSLIGLDYATDLAVLKIDAQGLIPAVFTDADDLAAGDSIAVVGNPVGQVINISGGILASVNPSFSYQGFPLEVLQISMELGDIASGSALVNAAGQVIGIINMDMAEGLGDIGDISFAISMQSARPIIDELLQNGFVAGRPSSGLTVSELPSSYAAYYKYPSSVYISAVQQGSTAEEAGVCHGDLVLAANGEPIDSVKDLYSVINGLQAGDTLTLSIHRMGETFEIAFPLMEASRLIN